MFTGKKFFITGSSGFIGSNLIKRLLKENAEIIGTYNFTLPQVCDSRVKYVKVNLLEPDICNSYLEDIDYLIMTAGYVGGASRIENTPEKFLTDNTIININTLSSAYKCGVKKCVFISSSMVYPLSKEALEEENGFLDNPYNKYFSGGWGKRIGEILCQFYGGKLKHHMDISVIRVDNIYGPYDEFSKEKSHVIAALIKKGINKENPFEIWGTGEEIKDFLYVDDLIDGIFLALQYNSPYEVFNIASGQNFSINEVASLIIQLCKYSPEIYYNCSKPVMVPYKKISIKKAETLLGFKPKTELKDGIYQTMEWVKEQRKWDV